MQRLPKFIREHIEEILSEWEAFARTLPIAESMDIVALRDHAKEMLGVIANDLDTPQTSAEQSDKSKGKSDAAETGEPASAAQEHGAARAWSGFSMPEMLSELRALRASVIRLWTKQQPQFVATDLDDLTRFNEAIDQAIAESVTQFSEDVGQSKERFLAILGHDLRNPLGAIITSAAFMMELGTLDEPHRNLTSRIGQSARRMDEMVSDLLDYTRTSFGGNIPLKRADMNVEQMLLDVSAEVAMRYPDATLKTESDGHLNGQWDLARLAQALTNLVSNAVQHGDRRSPITITAHGAGDRVVIAVRNEGSAIPEEDLPHIFKAGVQSASADTKRDQHLGLGLYIVERIVAAHSGTIDVRSTLEEGTTFTIHLPRLATNRSNRELQDVRAISRIPRAEHSAAV